MLASKGTDYSACISVMGIAVLVLARVGSVGKEVSCIYDTKAPLGLVFGRFDLAALCGCHTLNVCCCCEMYTARLYIRS